MSSKDVASKILAAAGIPLDSSEPWSIQVHHEKLWDRVISQQGLGFAESYMDGWWDCAAIDVMLTKLLHQWRHNPTSRPYNFPQIQVPAAR